MHKKYISLLVIILVLAGCGKKKKLISQQAHNNQDNGKVTRISLPTANTDMDAFFDESVFEFDVTDDNVYTWAKVAEQDGYKPVYFDFDHHEIRTNQKDQLARIAKQVKKELGRHKNRSNTVVIEGHACHAAGSSVYNLAKSEKRAKSVYDFLVASGIPRDRIKVVGRGKEIPAVIQGKIVSGSRQEQWPNRRTEIRIV